MPDGVRAREPREVNALLGNRGNHYPDVVRLLERDHELGVLAEACLAAASGSGSAIAVTGESGAGKSSVIAQALDAVPEGLRVLRGQCDPLATPRPLGPFRGLGFATSSVDPVPALADLGERVLAELGAQPTVLVVEDLHWVDEVSADLLRFLARRIETAPVALVLSYRDLEIGPRHPLRPLLGDFASREELRSLTLRPLSVGAISELVSGTGLDPARVHDVTGGNPFFATAVAREPDRPMPGSVRDAVLARVNEFVDEDLEVLQLVATAPDGLDDRVLPSLGVDLPTLRRLDETGLLTRTSHSVVFRHELARLAVASTIPPGGAALLHTRLLDGLEQIEPRDPAVLTHHAAGARDAARTLEHATAAAAEAVATSSHTEAAAFLEIALTAMPASASAAERAALLMRLAEEQYVTCRHGDAIVSARASIPLWHAAGDLAGAAEAHSALSTFEYQQAHRPACDEHLRQAVELAEASGKPRTIARAHTDAAMIALVCSALDTVRASAARILEVADEAGLEEFEIAGRLMAVSADAFCGSRASLSEAIVLTERARDLGLDELAWRGYLVATWPLLQEGDLRSAQRIIEQTLEFATERDIPLAMQWHTALRAVLHVRSGRWSAAVEDAEMVKESGLKAVYPDLVLGMVETRLGTADASAHLDEAWRLACGNDEPSRYLQVLAALAESMWMTGRDDPRVTEHAVNRLPALASSPDCRWSVGEVASWLRRLGLEVQVLPASLGEPYGALMDGRFAEAATWWQRSSSPFAEAMAWSDSPDPGDRVRAITMLDQLGATATADRLRIDLRRDGIDAVPQRPRESTRANPGQLTNRQLEVARLVAHGMSNNEIAVRLFISPKTADHHVSAVLAKLGLSNRRAVMAQATELGLV